jgi:hypothetical protein
MHTVSYCIILYHTVSYCTILYYTVSYCIILYHTVSYCIIHPYPYRTQYVPYHSVVLNLCLFSNIQLRMSLTSTPWFFAALRSSPRDAPPKDSKMNSYSRRSKHHDPPRMQPTNGRSSSNTPPGRKTEATTSSTSTVVRAAKAAFPS